MSSSDIKLLSENVRGLSNFKNCVVKITFIDPAGRYIGIETQINDESYFLLNVYGPNNDNQAAQFYWLSGNFNQCLKVKILYMKTK